MSERAFGKKIDTWRMIQGGRDVEIEVRMAVGAPEPFLAIHKAAGIEIRSADINKLKERVRVKLEENERAGEPEIAWTLYFHVEVRLDVDESDGFGSSAGLRWRSGRSRSASMASAGSIAGRTTRLSGRECWTSEWSPTI